jgi:hypothetical protein
MNTAAESYTPRSSYLTFKDGELIETSNQFAMGNAAAYVARRQAPRTETMPRAAAHGAS